MSIGQAARSAMPAQLDAAWSFGDALGGHLANGRRHQAKQMVDQMLAVVVIGVVIIVGILVYGEIESSLPAPDNSNLANTQDNTTNTFGDAMELAPVVLLVVIASLILSVVRRF